MTTLKLENRKNTTKAGLKALDELINSFDFCDDIDDIESSRFSGTVDGNGDDQPTSNVDSAFLKLSDGYLFFVPYSPEYGECTGIKRGATVFEKIDFGGVMDRLSEVVEAYNLACKEKDEQIEKFLSFCVAIDGN